MACERIKKLLGNNTGSSEKEDEKSKSTTQMPQASTAASSTTASSGPTSSTTSSSGPTLSTTASSEPTSSTTASSGSRSSTTASSGPTSSTTASSSSESLNDFQKKTISNYEKHMNRDCSFKTLSELNPNIEKLDEDILYHIALGNKSHDLQKMFKDVKFIVMGGTPKRMEQFAYYIMNEIGYELPPGTLLNDISKHSHRYAMYKVGPIMSVSHGMGMPSIGILLHELIKLVHHAGMVDPIFVRVGTCGGFSQKGGTVVVSDEVVNDYLESVYELSILGANVRFPANLDQNLASELAALADPQDDFQIIKGKTYCTDSFYDGSGRADGAICEFSTDEGMGYYQSLKKNNVVNVEMESLAFAALTCRAGIKSAVLAVILSDRLETDQIKQPKEVMDEWKMRPQRLLARYIKKTLAASGMSFAKTTTTGAPSEATRQDGQRPTVTVITPGVTPSGKIVCPPLSCGRKSTGGASTTSQPFAATSTQPVHGGPTESSSCKSVCQKRPIPGMDEGTTGAPTTGTSTTGASTKPTSTTESAKSSMATAKANTQDGWRSCYKACGVGSEQVDAGTSQASQQQTTVKPSVNTSDAVTKKFDCSCDRGKIAEPGQTPITKATSAGTIKPCSEHSAPGATIASTTSRSTTAGSTTTGSATTGSTTNGSTTVGSTTVGSTTSVPTYRAKDFDSSTKSTDPNDSRTAYYKSCVKVPKCDREFTGQKRPSGTFETPMQETTKGTAPTISTAPTKSTTSTNGTATTKAGETRPCCMGRSENTQSPRTQAVDKQKYIEDRLAQESQASPSKLPSDGTIRRASLPQPGGSMELGPCCTGQIEQKTPKPVGGPELGPCCAGKVDNESPPECAATNSPESETLKSTISEKSEESPPIQSGAPTSSRGEDKGREIPSDCPLVLGKKCNARAYTENGMRSTTAKPTDPSPETPDPRHGTIGPVFSTTPIPGSKTDEDTSRDQSTTSAPFVTPSAGSRGSCCGKSTSKNGAAAKLSSTTSRQIDSACGQKVSSAGGFTTSTSKPTDFTNGRTKSTAPTSKSTAPTSKSEQKKFVENKPTEHSMERRTSKVQSAGGSQLGPCCAGKEEPIKSKAIETSGLGPCCTGQKDKESPPECADANSSKSETYQSTIREKSNESSLPQKGATTDQTTDPSKRMSTDCIKLMKAKCNYKSDTENGQKMSTTDRPLDYSAEDSRTSTRATAFTTPIPGSTADPDTPHDQSTTAAAFVTPTAGGRGSCCLKSNSKNGGVSATLASTTDRKSGGSCCHQFSTSDGRSVNGTSNGTSKPSNGTFTPSNSTTTCRPKSKDLGFKSTSDVNKYDESPSPCAACKKYQDSKIIYTGGTPSVSQPEIIKCPHKLKRLKDECQGYD